METALYEKRLATSVELNAKGLDEAKAFIDENWPRITGTTLKSAADVARLSPFYFHRIFRKRFGKTPKQIARDHQIAEAKRLLLSGVPQDVVVDSCGFCHQSAFCVVFKQVVGQSPGRWCRQQRQGNEPAPSAR